MEREKIRNTTDRLSAVCGVFQEDMEYIATIWCKELLLSRNEREREIIEGSNIPVVVRNQWFRLEEEE